MCTNVRCHVVASAGSDLTLRPFTNEVKVVGSLSADMGLANVLLSEEIKISLHLAGMICRLTKSASASEHC